MALREKSIQKLIFILEFKGCSAYILN